MNMRNVFGAFALAVTIAALVGLSPLQNAASTDRKPFLHRSLLSSGTSQSAEGETGPATDAGTFVPANHPSDRNDEPGMADGSNASTGSANVEVENSSPNSFKPAVAPPHYQ
jgi:hypothetical protein